MLLRILEQSQDIVANDDAFLSRQNVLDTHIVDCEVGFRAWFEMRGELSVVSYARIFGDSVRESVQAVATTEDISVVRLKGSLRRIPS